MTRDKLIYTPILSSVTNRPGSPCWQNKDKLLRWAFSDLCDQPQFIFPDYTLGSTQEIWTALSGAIHLPCLLSFIHVTYIYEVPVCEEVPVDGCSRDTPCTLFPGWLRSQFKLGVLPGEGFGALQFITDGIQRMILLHQKAGWDKLLGWGCSGTDENSGRLFLEHQEGNPFKPEANHVQ